MNKINVVHIVTEENTGAGRAAKRICDAINGKEVASKLYVVNNSEFGTANKIYYSFTKRIWKRVANRINSLILKKYNMKGFFSGELCGNKIMDLREIQNADIIHLHWLNNGIWSHNFARELVRHGKPVVWTMHDMWSFTGGCHYDGACGRYYNGCGNCPMLSSEKKNDLSKREIEYKKKIFSKLNIGFVGCSRWITRECQHSIVISGKINSCSCISNPVPSGVFKVRNKQECRNMLDLKTDKKLIVFGACASNTDDRKGYIQLLNVIKYLNPSEYVFGVFGTNNFDKNVLPDYEIFSMGYIEDDLHLSILYNAADVFVAPSLQENLANTVMESLVCGTPVVAFDIGGMPDMIEHLKNGYLAQRYDEKDFAKGIQTMCEKELDPKQISLNTKTKFSEEKVAKEYVELYKKLINRKV